MSPSGNSQPRAGAHQSPQITLTPRPSSTMPKIWVARSLLVDRRLRLAVAGQPGLGGHEDPREDVGEDAGAAEEQHHGGDADDARGRR